MVEIINHGVGKKIHNYTCDMCGAEFKTDEDVIVGTSAMSIAEYFPIINVMTFECECPQCHSKCITKVAKPSDKYEPSPPPCWWA